MQDTQQCWRWVDKFKGQRVSFVGDLAQCVGTEPTFLLRLQSLSEPRPPSCWGFEITLRYIKIDRTPLGEWSARRRELYLTKKKAILTRKRYPRLRRDSKPPSQQASGRRPTPIKCAATRTGWAYKKLVNIVKPIDQRIWNHDESVLIKSSEFGRES